MVAEVVQITESKISYCELVSNSLAIGVVDHIMYTQKLSEPGKPNQVLMVVNKQTSTKGEPEELFDDWMADWGVVPLMATKVKRVVRREGLNNWNLL